MTTSPYRPAPFSRTLRLLAVTAVSGLLLAGVAGCSGDDAPTAGDTSGSGATGSTGATGSSASAAAPPVETAKPSAATSRRPEVKVGEAAALQQKVSVRVVSVRPVTLKAKGPGELAGAGAAVRLRVRNASTAAIDLDQLAVNASYGRGTPAVPNTSQGGQLAGALKAGAARSGTYYFKVPSSSLSTLRVEVSSGSSPYVITFVND